MAILQFASVISSRANTLENTSWSIGDNGATLRGYCSNVYGADLYRETNKKDGTKGSRLYCCGFCWWMGVVNRESHNTGLAWEDSTMILVIHGCNIRSWP